MTRPHFYKNIAAAHAALEASAPMAMYPAAGMRWDHLEVCLRT